MADIQIEASLQLDGGQAVAQVQVLQKQVQEAKNGFERLGDVVENLKGGFTALKGAMELFGIEGDGVQKVLQKVSAALDVAEGISKLNKFEENFSKLVDTIKASTAFKLIDNAATEAATAVQTAFGVAVDTTSASFVALKTAIALTGIGLLITGIALAISAISDFIEKQKEAEAIQKDLTEANVKATQESTRQNVELQALVTTAKAHNLSLKERQHAVDELNKKMDLHTGKITLQNIETSKAAKKIDDYIKNIKAKALAQAYITKIQDLYNKQIELENTNLEDNIHWYNKVWNFIKNGGDLDETEKANLETEKANKKESIDLIHDQIIAMQKELDNKIRKGDAIVAVDQQINDREEDFAAQAVKRIENHYQQLIVNNTKEEQLQINREKKANESELNIFETQAEFQRNKIKILEDYYNEIKDKDAKAASDLRTQIDREYNILYDDEVKADRKRSEKFGTNRGEVFKVTKPTQLDLNKKIGIDDVANTKIPGINTDQTELKKQQEQLDDDLLNLNQSSLNKQLQQDKAFYDEKRSIAITNSELMHKLDMYYLNQKLEVTASILGQLTDLFGKQTAAGKATAIAEATINTYLAASKALTGITTGNPFGAAVAIAQAAIIIATGLKNVKSIIATKVPGQSDGGSPSVDASSPSAPLSPTPVQTSTNLNQDQINQIGNAAASRVYVLDSDIQNNRERDARLNRAARLGG